MTVKDRRSHMVLRCFTSFIVFLMAAFAMFSTGHGEELPRPVVTELLHFKIGIVTDGPLTSTPGMVEMFKNEIQHVAEDEFNVSFPPAMTLEADGTPTGINRHLDTLLNDPEVSLLIALGTIASTEAIKRTDPAKPIIAPLILDNDLQHAPGETLGSGIPNLTYILLGVSIDHILTAFRNIVPFRKLAIILDQRDLTGIPSVKKLVSNLANEHTISITLVGATSSAEGALTAIPADIEAVMVGPLWQFTPKEFALLSQGLIQRRLPSFSMWEYDYVEQGLLATTMPEKTLEHLARRVSITTQEILLGEEAATIPVAFSKTQKMAFNMDTARAIDVYPSLDQMTGAILLNEKRRDIERRLTLAEAVQEALAANLDLAVAERQVSAGAYGVNEARSALLPQVGIGVGGRVIDDDRAAISQGNTPEKAWTGSAAASQQIYSESGWAGYTVEKHRQSGREFSRDTVRLDIILDAAVSYLNVLRRKTVEQLQKDNMQLTQANLERAQIRLSTGVAGPDELYRWQTKFANDRQVVLRSESASLDAMQALNRILHRPLQEEFVAEETDLSDPLLMTGDQLFYQLMHSPRYLKDFNSFAVQESLALSPELHAIDAGIAAQERIITKSKRDYWLPDFTLEGDVNQIISDSGAGQRNKELTGLDDTDWSVGVFARLPLIEGGRKNAALGRNREQLNQLKTERLATAERISQRTLAAFNNTRASYPAINLSREAADAARRNLQLVTDSYVQGIKSIIDLLDAQNQALNSDLDAANAVYNFLIDLMGVQRSIGEFITFLPKQQQEEWLQRAKDHR